MECKLEKNEKGVFDGKCEEWQCNGFGFVNVQK